MPARSSIGRLDQAGKAALAAATALFMRALSAFGHLAKAWPVAGLTTSKLVGPSTSLPSISMWKASVIAGSLCDLDRCLGRAGPETGCGLDWLYTSKHRI